MVAPVLHVVVDAAPNHADLTAWVSAGAAAVQAVAASVAIWFTVTLAREAAEREGIANAAAERRIADAEAAAAKQRQLDAEAAELQREIGRVDRHNLPIDQMLNFAEASLQDLSAFRTKMEEAKSKSPAELFWPDEVRGLAQFKERGLNFIEQAPDSLTATRMRRLYDTFDALPPVGDQPPAWLRRLVPKEQAIETAMDELRCCRLTPPALLSPPPATP